MAIMLVLLKFHTFKFGNYKLTPSCCSRDKALLESIYQTGLIIPTEHHLVFSEVSLRFA